MYKELNENANEFYESGIDNLKKNRFNASTADFFKTIVISCDYLIYSKIRALPKNHSEWFLFLKIHYPDIEKEISKLFSIYTQSYNLKVNKEQAKLLEQKAKEYLGKCIKN